MKNFTNNELIAKDSSGNNRLFCELFKDSVAKCSDKVAIVWKDKVMTYKELDEKSTLVARCIAGKGVGPEDIVTIRTGRSLDSIVAMIGILKAGAAFLFLDATNPEERLEYMIRDCKCPLIITQYFMDNMDSMNHCEPKSCKPENLAAIIYTSGSTGKPKGIMIEQKNITALIASHTELEINQEDVLGAFANFCFVAAINDIFTILAVGGTIDIVPFEIRKDIKALAQYYIDNKITITYLPPHMAAKYIKLDADNTTLKTLLVGSECAHNLKKRHYKIRNIYASSELCNFVSSYLITEEATSYPIGKIKSSLKYYIIDEDNNEVKDGETGELCISGPQVSRGYLNNPEKTAEQYIKNPFTQEEEYKVLYKTRDLVKKLPDGNLKFVCRKDWMLKIRGYRVESSEVELCMLKYPEITEAAVTAYTDDGGTNILCGYFTANHEVDINAIKTFLKQHLPSYMVPLKIMQLDDFPRNKNNKIEKNALPIPNFSF
jgi:amino acid adenylation domain-containing protein